MGSEGSEVQAVGIFWDQSSKALQITKGGQQRDLASEHLRRDPRHVQHLQGCGKSVTFVHSNNNSKAIQSIFLAFSIVGNSAWVSSVAAFAVPLESSVDLALGAQSSSGVFLLCVQADIGFARLIRFAQCFKYSSC